MTDDDALGLPFAAAREQDGGGLINAGPSAEQRVEESCRQDYRSDQQGKPGKRADLLFQVFKEMHLNLVQEFVQVDAALLQFSDKTPGGIEAANLRFLYRGKQ